MKKVEMYVEVLEQSDVFCVVQGWLFGVLRTQRWSFIARSYGEEKVAHSLSVIL